MRFCTCILVPSVYSGRCPVSVSSQINCLLSNYPISCNKFTHLFYLNPSATHLVATASHHHINAMWPLRSGPSNANVQPTPPPGLFQDVPGIPSTSTTMPQSPPPTIPTSTQAQSTIPEEYTLDEPVWKTIWRDIVTIARNLRSVLIPVNWKFHGQAQALRNWDLWGPLVFMLILAIVLSIHESNASQVFAMVFAEVALGAIILTINVILLGGELVFFQAICLLGYCLFPLVVAAIICASVKIKWIRSLVTLGCLAWASVATIPFIGNAVPRGRKALAVYPVMLMYVSLAWLALVKS